MTTFDVIGFGESSVDHVCVVAELPDRDTSKLRIESSFWSPGGQVATTMVACASLGLATSYLGAIGDDESERYLREELARRGVDTSRLIVRHAATRTAIVLVSATTGERLVLWQRDEALNVPPNHIAGAVVNGARVVHVDAVDEAASIRVATLARETGAIVTCDVDAVTAHTSELLAHTTLPILAADVPSALTGLTDVEQALRAIRLTHPGTLCVTLGDRGSAALEGDEFIQVPGVPVKPIDTTGAGDIFRAGFIYGVLQRWPIHRVLTFANTAAALSCTRRGALTSVPSLAEITAAIRSRD